MITAAYISTIIAQAQRAAADYAYTISEKIKHGEDPDLLWKKLKICIDGADVLQSNNDLTNNEKQIIVDKILVCGNIAKYSSSPVTFSTVTVVSYNECDCETPEVVDTSINVANTLFVSKDGNDSTGLRERFDKHFLTITAAQTSAVSGDTIIIYPGTYTDTSLGKNGITYHFMTGANINTTGQIFYVVTPMSLNITGYGSFTSDNKMFRFAAAGTFNVTCLNITQTGAYGVEAVGIVSTNAVANITVLGKILCSDRGINVTTGGKAYITAKNVEAARLAFSNEGGSGSQLYVECDDILVTGSSANTDTCVAVIGDGYTEIRSRFRMTNASSSWGAITCATTFSGTLKTYGDIESSGVNAMYIVGTVTGTYIHRGNITGGKIDVTSGLAVNLSIYGDIVSSVNGTAVIIVSSSNVYLNGKVSNTFSNANSHAITKQGGTLRLDGTVLVAAHASANSIFGLTSAQDIKILKNVVANKNVGGQVITNVVSGTTLIVDSDVE